MDKKRRKLEYNFRRCSFRANGTFFTMQERGYNVLFCPGEQILSNRVFGHSAQRDIRIPDEFFRPRCSALLVGTEAPSSAVAGSDVLLPELLGLSLNAEL
ncbi:MAG: hypothetical protein Q8P83_01510 [bacterium]|nr:hypothetical protein [bacterium]